MDNQHRKIKGYRELDEREITAINQLKGLGSEMEEAAKHLLEVGADPRWIEIGRTHLQQGVMAWVRAIAKPESF